jgi:hypothetical protein
MEYYTLIRHQSLVTALGSRSLPLRVVYAHILGYTQRKGEWQGDVKELAAQIELPIQTVRDQLKTLTTKGLLTINGNSYTATVPNNTTTVPNNTAAVQTDTRAVPNNTAAVQPQTPINYINKMKSNEIIARDTIATPNPLDQYSFDRLENLFMKRTGTFQMAESVRNDSRSLWEQYPLWKRILLLEELTKPTGQVRPRLDWTLSAFNPQPKFLSGLDQDNYWKSSEWTKNHKPLVMVEHEGLCKVCTEQTMRTFDLKFKRNVKPYND